ncbi:very-long-chain 3-oxoacyl-CoA reductase-like [Dysidea avara]|uniref:very-long-chain 3-oxoacyl-CoA reductase-like n=1 Tax=Dysidea avara TaxID=196820 RepID=UPI0033166DB5
MEVLFQYLDQYPMMRNFVFLLGSLYVLKIMVWLIPLMWGDVKAYLLSGLFHMDMKFSQYKWAVVTGASDGIGKQYAIALAKFGVNVVLISRSEDKLKAVEKEILDQCNMLVKIVVADFSEGANIYDHIRMELSGLEVGILINNVAACYDYPEYFLEIPSERLQQIVTINTASVVMMTKIILPVMLERKKGIIVNVSSIGSTFPLPLYTVYSATKKYIDYFTASLQYEYSNRGVIIQHLQPSTVATKMLGIEQTSFTVLSPKKYVRDAISTIGIQDRSFGTLAHALQGWIFKILPEWFLMPFIFKAEINMKREAIRKLQQKQ